MNLYIIATSKGCPFVFITVTMPDVRISPKPQYANKHRDSFRIDVKKRSHYNKNVKIVTQIKKLL